MLITISLVSFKDDIKPIDPLLRLIIQLICVYVSVSSLNLNIITFPLKVKIFVAIIVWVYFINITNFVDGSDGFCAINVITFFVGILIINYSLNLNLFSATISKILIPLIISFLFFNFPPAKIYMGDAGSVFLGFLVGYSFLELSINGYIFYALVLYAYPLTDCSITLVKKVSKGYLPWARLGDYFFLKLKKRIPEKYTSTTSRFIFFSTLITNMINLFIIYLSIRFNKPFLLFFSFVATLTLLVIFHLLSLARSNFLKKFFGS
jgi:UDP-N-acetylmuramyl pentapeptide phosphotransferase/UDP-N-acetylglucosamine-1-phosphate transferase